MDHTFVLQAYHILFIILGIGSSIGVFIRFYIKSIKSDLKEIWSKELTDTKYFIEKKVSNLEIKVNDDVKQLNNYIKEEASTENIKTKIKDYVNGELKVMEQDIRQIKDISNDLRQLLNNQQETLIAIQMGISELKPKIENLEARVQKLENSK